MSHSASSTSCRQLYHYATILLLLAAASWTSDAFTVVVPAATTKKTMQMIIMQPSFSVRAAPKIRLLFATPNDDDITETSMIDDESTKKKLTHADITWKLRPPENTTKLTRLQTKIGANVLRLYSKFKGQKLPPVLCPKGGRAMLEAYYREPGLFKRRRMIGRFGFTTSRGPSNTESAFRFRFCLLLVSLLQKYFRSQSYSFTCSFTLIPHTTHIHSRHNNPTNLQHQPPTPLRNNRRNHLHVR